MSNDALVYDCQRNERNILQFSVVCNPAARNEMASWSIFFSLSVLSMSTSTMQKSNVCLLSKSSALDHQLVHDIMKFVSSWKKYYSIIVLRVIYLKKIARDPVDTNIYIYFFVSFFVSFHSNFHYLNYIRLLKIAVNKEEWNNHFNLHSQLCRNKFYLQQLNKKHWHTMQDPICTVNKITLSK